MTRKEIGPGCNQHPGDKQNSRRDEAGSAFIELVFELRATAYSIPPTERHTFREERPGRKYFPIQAQGRPRSRGHVSE